MGHLYCPILNKSNPSQKFFLLITPGVDDFTGELFLLVKEETPTLHKFFWRIEK